MYTWAGHLMEGDHLCPWAYATSCNIKYELLTFCRPFRGRTLVIPISFRKFPPGNTNTAAKPFHKTFKENWGLKRSSKNVDENKTSGYKSLKSCATPCCSYIRRQIVLLVQIHRIKSLYLCSLELFWILTSLFHAG